MLGVMSRNAPSPNQLQNHQCHQLRNHQLIHQLHLEKESKRVTRSTVKNVITPPRTPMDMEKQIIIKPSKIHGRGAFADENIKRGDFIIYLRVINSSFLFYMISSDN